MNDRTQVAIVAAMEREIAPLVQGWEMILGPRYHYYERDNVIVVCGGIGMACARDAADTVMTFRQPSVIISAGLAGSLQESLPVGSVVFPTKVLRAEDEQTFTIEGGEGTLVSVRSVANPETKRELAKKYSAVVVDMEAAAVAEVAQSRGVRFIAVKAVSDDLAFEMPEMNRYIGPNGEFHTARFAIHAALRPAIWPALARLKRNSDVAIQALCRTLARFTAAREVDVILSRARAS
jgi:adenosylhomocysteine nucleosidase